MSGGTSLRAAIVGAGLMGKWHADAVRKIGGVVSIVADRDPSRAYGFARDLGAGGCRTGAVGAALSSALVDVVHICTPPSDHPAIVRSALAAGLHVVCEKPLAETSATTAELHADAAERELLLCPVHQYLIQDAEIRQAYVSGCCHVQCRCRRWRRRRARPTCDGRPGSSAVSYRATHAGKSGRDALECYSGAVGGDAGCRDLQWSVTFHSDFDPQPAACEHLAFDR